METLRVPFVDLKAQYRLLKEEMDRAVIDVFEGGGYILESHLRHLRPVSLSTWVAGMSGVSAPGWTR